MGMTRQEVFGLMEKYYPKNGTRLPPKVLNDTPDGLGFFMNPESFREPNCEGIFLTLDAGRVCRKDYSQD